ncbi:putative Mg2+ transporter-C (MgtC) family protein [Sphingobacterium allocomposti]|jgi:putative Mg2+ transporter-C (MgtC) family protein|uniref:Putative Mg2+ transporter-C (MgtC) family protein n=1 Tax=Sphingobacterium allocomposti TaxID=415956 RepID=A0A5S5DLC4_9SPHI|nr:MgtC/SapB family protein [Sphingobacterium composti Yoo et al. 2007 non Ten et al. 2007]TYP96515.1 putative Mg2+ transporter-C (MgtC) family protein [Sphingobacterium composti Yoo et al. 2007 non Ten et al. 2007]HLS94636.1 MgtC/SapB family protein [Sphingobacterium sp.]
MFEWLEDTRLQSILVSIACGAVVGFEREYKNKSAGFRTVILICFGSTVFTLLSRMGNVSDDRIAANIVTGIGFLGAGVIYQGKFTVQGLTTAAVIWAMAGIGMIIGFEEYSFGLVLTALMVVILSLFQKMENLLANIYFMRTIYVTFQDIQVSNLGEFENFMKEHRVSLIRKGLEKKGQHLTVIYEISGKKKDIRLANDAIISLEYVYAFNNL